MFSSPQKPSSPEGQQQHGISIPLRHTSPRVHPPIFPSPAPMVSAVTDPSQQAAKLSSSFSHCLALPHKITSIPPPAHLYYLLYRETRSNIPTSLPGKVPHPLPAPQPAPSSATQGAGDVPALPPSTQPSPPAAFPLRERRTSNLRLPRAGAQPSSLGPAIFLPARGHGQDTPRSPPPATWGRPKSLPSKLYPPRRPPLGPAPPPPPRCGVGRPGRRGPHPRAPPGKAHLAAAPLSPPTSAGAGEPVWARGGSWESPCGEQAAPRRPAAGGGAARAAGASRCLRHLERGLLRRRRGAARRSARTHRRVRHYAAAAAPGAAGAARQEAHGDAPRLTAPAGAASGRRGGSEAAAGAAAAASPPPRGDSPAPPLPGAQGAAGRGRHSPGGRLAGAGRERRAAVERGGRRGVPGSPPPAAHRAGRQGGRGGRAGGPSFTRSAPRPHRPQRTRGDGLGGAFAYLSPPR